MENPPIRVLLADDHPVVLDGLYGRLTSLPHIEIVGTAQSFAEVPPLLDSLATDVLVLDLGGMGGAPLTLVQRVRREHPQVGLIVFSSSIDLAPEMLQAGVLGYVVKEDMTSQLVNALMAVARGQPWRSAVVEEYLERGSGVQRFHQLAPKELSVLKLLAQGMSTTEIAEDMGIDPRTVQNYITAMRRKTGCEERTQLVNWYRRMHQGGES